MKGTKIMMAVLALWLVMSSVQGNPLFFPLSEHTMAKDVAMNSMPIWRTFTFSSQDEQAVSWLNIWRDNKIHNVEWRWYYPGGRVYARSYGVVPASDGFLGLWGAPIWSTLKIKGCDVQDIPGLWKVVVLVDYKKVAEEYFTIDGGRAC
ncbi:MAG TPA: hypothetical protein VN455_00775 [Methanotrichaceae archaeon]|nr:hypothetical protein [Methanotrichaceae archaeon]